MEGWSCATAAAQSLQKANTTHTLYFSWPIRNCCMDNIDLIKMTCWWFVVHYCNVLLTIESVDQDTYAKNTRIYLERNAWISLLRTFHPLLWSNLRWWVVVAHLNASHYATILSLPFPFVTLLSLPRPFGVTCYDGWWYTPMLFNQQRQGSWPPSCGDIGSLHYDILQPLVL